MKFLVRAFFLLLALCLFTTLALAQEGDTCPTVVQTALATLDQICDNTGRNQACFGNVMLEAEARPDAAAFVFEKPGDMIDVVGVASLRLSSLDTVTETWGVALMNLQANLPDALPGQNVIFLLFGDVDLHNDVRPLTTLEAAVTAADNVNVRGGPTTTDAVIGAVSGGTTLVANGRSAAGDWLRVRLPDGQIGWVFAELVSPAEGMENLEIAAPGDPVYGPMQAFYLRSGIGDAPCEAAPNSGLLIRTPAGAGMVTLRVNAVDIALGSTLFLQASASDVLTINVIEGHADVTAFDVTQTATTGQRVQVPLDENLNASGAPTAPEAIDETDVQALPLASVGFTPDEVTTTTNAPATTSETSVTESAGDSGAKCLINVPQLVNSRRGPGTEYPAGEKLKPGYSAEATQQAVGVLGYTWYRLSSLVWVREDVVDESLECTTLPALEMSSFPSNHPWIYSIHTCSISTGPGSYGARPIRIGEKLELDFGVITPGTVGHKNRALVEGTTATITVDGTPQQISRTQLAYDQSAPDVYDGVPYSYVRTPLWTVTSGTHTITAEWNGYHASCTFTAVE